MHEPEIERLVRFATAVRQSSLKRLRAVPEGRENWRATEDSMSIADLAQHLLEADDWLLLKLRQPTLAAMKGRPRLIEIEDRDQFDALVDRLQESGERRSRRIAELAAEELSKRVPDERFGDEVSIWWLIVRGNLDHEIHHRGQISAYLRSPEWRRKES